MDNQSPAPVDYDLHGFVGIRLLDASPREVALITRQIGPLQAALTRAPEIEIQFVDQLPLASPLRYIGLDDVGFTEDAFVVLRSQYKTRARVQIPFERIGQHPLRLLCERGLTAVPLLMPIINLTALSRGLLPLHATALQYHGQGLLVTGWSKGGKTETLLGFMTHGASYIGDEWVYLHPDTHQMYGIPEPIRLWDWQLEQLPHFRATVKPRDLLRLRLLTLLVRLLEAGGNRWLPATIYSRLLPIVQRQLNVQVHPQRLFGEAACPLTGPLHQILFVVSHATPDIRVEAMSALDIAERMVFSLEHERLDFLAYYQKFRFAFPQLANKFIEQTETRQRELAHRVLAGKPAQAVYHPYPVSITALFDTISPLYP